MSQANHWVLFALGSTCFAALTAIFGKLGVPSATPADLCAMAHIFFC